MAIAKNPEIKISAVKAHLDGEITLEELASSIVDTTEPVTPEQAKKAAEAYQKAIKLREAMDQYAAVRRKLTPGILPSEEDEEPQAP